MKLSLGFLALAGAVAPPRIELNLEGMANAYRLQDPIYRDHDMQYKSRAGQKIKSRQDWTEKCAAKQSCQGNNCNLYTGDKPDFTETNSDNCLFPVAEGYDHHSGKVDVHTRVFLVDEEGTSKIDVTTPIFEHESKVHNKSKLDEKFSSRWSKRSTFLFKYDATDEAGNHAEQVVFALILDDAEAPFFGSKCADDRDFHEA